MVGGGGGVDQVAHGEGGGGGRSGGSQSVCLLPLPCEQNHTQVKTLPFLVLRTFAVKINE